MTVAELLMLVAAVLCIAAARWNATAAALAASFVVARGVYFATGEGMSSVGNLYVDIAVIAVIYSKAPAYECLPDGTFWRQFCSLWFEKSLWDRVVIGCFPLAWFSYVAPFGGKVMWWGMYWIAMAQFVAACWEAWDKYRLRRAANAAKARESLDASSSSSEFAWAGGGRLSG